MKTASRRVPAALAAASLALALAIGTAGTASAEPIQAPGPGQLRSFSILQTTPEGLPEEMARIFDEAELEAGHGSGAPHRCRQANPALAQRVPTHLGRIWVVPGRGCLAIAQAMGRTGIFPVVTSAATTEGAVKRGLAASTLGVVPDGVIAARFSPELTVPVTHNVYFFPVAENGSTVWRYPKLIHGAVASGG